LVNLASSAYHVARGGVIWRYERYRERVGVRMKGFNLRDARKESIHA
jgi:hypothetical protein